MLSFEENVYFVSNKYLKKVFDDTGCSGAWRNQDFPNSEWLISSIKLSLNDPFKQDRYFLVEHSSKTLNYRLYKENYLRILQDKDIYTLCELRTTPTTNYLWNLAGGIILTVSIYYVQNLTI
jgi:hypothetical protein